MTPSGMVRALAVSVALLVPAVADAAMMEHYDLAGLVMHSDTIIVADRTATKGKPSHFHVVKTLRGKADPDYDFDDSLYDMPANVQARVVVFLEHREGHVWIVQSGLRVQDAGKVFRFEQWNNPGGWALVPQGQDPQDQWQPPTPQLDAAGLDAAIAAAIKRVDALAAARKEPDVAKRRTAMLALLPAPGIASSRTGFYANAMANEVETTLAIAGDLEGALLAETRDHTPAWRRAPYGSISALVDYARDPKHPADLRALAIGAAVRSPDYFNNASAVRAMVALLPDPSPVVRAAAIDAAARPADGMSSDKAEQKQLTKLAGEARDAITKLYATETNNDVVFAIADSFDRIFRRALPSRKGAPAIAARLEVDHAILRIDVICTTKRAGVSHAKLVATQQGTPVPVTSYTIAPRCSDGSDGGGGSNDIALPPGTYNLAVELELDKKHVTQSIGTLIRDPNGETRWAP